MMFLRRLLSLRAVPAVLLFLTGLLTAPTAMASAGNNSIKIVAFYGAGNLSKSEYTRDTIILFNPTQAAITMNGWSIQTGGTTGAFTTVYQLPNATIPAGGYYAIAASGSAYVSGSGCTGANCGKTFAYDYELKTLEGTATTTDNILSSTNTTIALVSSQTALNTCSLTASTLVDVLGVGAADGSTTVSCFAGGGNAPYTPATLNGVTTNVHGTVYPYGTVRRNRCSDTFNNNYDFTLGYIDFENSQSTPQPCPAAGSQLGVLAYATPNNVATKTNFTITALITKPATSTGLTVTADLSNLGLSATTQLYDDGTHGDAVANDGIYSLTTQAASGYNGQVVGLNVTATDTQGNVAIGTIPFSLGGSSVPGPGNNNIEILGWFGAGNLARSLYSQDTVILFNPTQAAITMNGWSLQTGNAAGSFSTVYQLPNVTIPAGGYYAIAGSGPAYISGVGCQSNVCHTGYAYDYQLKTLEKTATTSDNDLSSTAVIAALVNNQTALGATCPQFSPHVVDLVGIGAFDGSSPVTCYAGTSYAGYIPSTINGTSTNINGLAYPYATARANRCQNTFDNSKDFVQGYIDFENSQSTPQPCGTGTPLTVSASVNPSGAGLLDAVTLTAAVTPATSPSSTGYTVLADLSNFGGSAQQPLYDDGTHGDKAAGDRVYSFSTTVQTVPAVGGVPGLTVTATDAQGNKAQSTAQFTVLPGYITMTATSLTATVKAGDVATFPLTITGFRGYNGLLNITCTGSPNANTLGVPVGTGCLPTPTELVMSTPNSSAKVNLAIATGLTKSAGIGGRSWPLMLLGGVFAALLAFFGRRRLLPTLLIVLATVAALGTTACGNNAGLQNVTAAPGTYTYVVTATDTNSSTINASLTFTITVQ